MTTSAEIPFAKSLVDYIFRWLGMEFIPGYREANAPKRTRSAGHDEAKRLVGEMRHAEGEVIESPPDESRKPVNPDPANMDEGSTTAMVAKMQRRLIEAGETARLASTMPPAPVSAVIGALDYSHAAMMGDAPACDVCGAITVRNANCYKCLNCGNSMGCS
jgi:ribonucleoside-diphosphate reductase alpha chain